MLPQTPSLPGRGHGRQSTRSPPELVQRLHNVMLLRNLQASLAAQVGLISIEELAHAIEHNTFGPRRSVRTSAGTFRVSDDIASTSKPKVVKTGKDGQFEDSEQDSEVPSTSSK